MAIGSKSVTIAKNSNWNLQTRFVNGTHLSGIVSVIPSKCQALQSRVHMWLPECALSQGHGTQYLSFSAFLTQLKSEPEPCLPPEWSTLHHSHLHEAKRNISWTDGDACRFRLTSAIESLCTQPVSFTYYITLCKISWQFIALMAPETHPTWDYWVDMLKRPLSYHLNTTDFCL